LSGIAKAETLVASHSSGGTSRKGERPFICIPSKGGSADLNGSHGTILLPDRAWAFGLLPLRSRILCSEALEERDSPSEFVGETEVEETRRLIGIPERLSKRRQNRQSSRGKRKPAT
jgi:hypothetical protein